MIIVAGTGVAGSYLCRRLWDSGIEFRALDPKVPGFRLPCGYATNYNIFADYCKNAGLNPQDYVERQSCEITFTGDGMPELTFRSRGLCTIDKNRFEADLIDGIPVARSRAAVVPGSDLYVDATGISRALLGPSGKDFRMHAVEYLADEATHDDFYFRYFPGGHGYYWEFPLADGYHIGAGSDDLQLIRSALSGVKAARTMARDIRLRPLLQDSRKGNVIGIGESIGTVSPITGEGIMPSMASAEILYKSILEGGGIDDVYRRYRKLLLEEFGYYGKLFRILMDARSGNLGRVGNLPAIPAVRMDLRNFGIDVKILRILRELLAQRKPGPG